MVTSKKSARLRLPVEVIQPVPDRQMSWKSMGCCDTFTSCVVGAAPVISPLVSTGQTTWSIQAFQTWLAVVLLGLASLLEPYHTASARPGPAALIHGKTFTASPLALDPSLTCPGVGQLFQQAADEPLTALALPGGA